MIRYCWEDILKYTNNKPEVVLDYFKYIYYLTDTKDIYLAMHDFAKKIYYSKSYKGSYILNVNDLIINRQRATDEERFIYLDLLSKRDVFSYYNSKGKRNYVEIWKLKDMYDIDQLQNNKLLHIRDNRRYFIYEGDENGN